MAGPLGPGASPGQWDSGHPPSRNTHQGLKTEGGQWRRCRRWSQSHVTHSAGQVSANGGVSQQLQADLTLPLPAVLDVLVAAKAVFAGAMEGGHMVSAPGTTVR